MNVRDALKARKSVRAFLDKPVETSMIEALLDAARHSPSGANTQPWQVAVVSGAKKCEIQQKMESRFGNGQSGKMDYQYYPVDWFSPFIERRRATGLQLYTALGIERAEKQLGYPEKTILLCGMALGYEDEGAVVNSYRTPRIDVQTFTRFYDDVDNEEETR